MIAGMNLDRSRSTTKEKSEYEYRSERIRDETIEEIIEKKEKPYNRTFESDVALNGRVARREQRKQSRMEVSFYSWVIGVFSALILIMVAWSLLRGWDILPSGTQWEPEESRSMIIETPNN